VYCLRNGSLKQLTEDHSLLNDYLKARKLSPDEIESFPHKNVIVRALGMKDTVQIDLERLEPMDGDLYMICSDGLSGMVPDHQIERTLVEQPELKSACSELVLMANAAGGSDNVTCVLARFHKS
jgi:protein phosphatase